MAVIFTSVIKNDKKGGWFIELTDTMDNRIEWCLNLEEYAQKIEQMGADYGNDIEVKWSSDSDVHPASLDELRIEMAEFQRKYQEEIDKMSDKNS